jgi:hypothetical protein
MNVFALLMLIFFMFSILGVFFFRKITRGDSINEIMNFSDFDHAMVMLFRISTGEDWNRIMFDTMNYDQDCVPNETCGSIMAVPFFLLFILICTYIMLNLFILVIIQQFDKYYLPVDNIMSKFKDSLVEFKEVWKEFTFKYNCQRIKEDKLVPFFKILKQPLGMPHIQNDKEVQKQILAMGIRKTENGFIYFNELLFRSMKRAYGTGLPPKREMSIAELKTTYKLFVMT